MATDTTAVTKESKPELFYAPDELQTDAAKAEYINLVKRELIAGKGSATPTEAEVLFFLQVCKSSGLNPLTRQIYAIYRGGKMTIQTGIDGLRAIAERTGRYAGSNAGVFEYDSESGKVERATVTVKKIVNGQIIETTASAKWSEYAVENNPMWKKMPETMLEKCAEAKALRKAFPNIGQVYTDEEMHQADRTTPHITEAEVVKANPDDVKKDVKALVDSAMEERTTASSTVVAAPPEGEEEDDDEEK